MQEIYKLNKQENSQNLASAAQAPGGGKAVTGKKSSDALNESAALNKSDALSEIEFYGQNPDSFEFLEQIFAPKTLGYSPMSDAALKPTAQSPYAYLQLMDANFAAINEDYLLAMKALKACVAMFEKILRADEAGEISLKNLAAASASSSAASASSAASTSSAADGATFDLAELNTALLSAKAAGDFAASVSARQAQLAMAEHELAAQMGVQISPEADSETITNALRGYIEKQFDIDLAAVTYYASAAAAASAMVRKQLSAEPGASDAIAAIAGTDAIAALGALNLKAAGALAADLATAQLEKFNAANELATAASPAEKLLAKSKLALAKSAYDALSGDNFAAAAAAKGMQIAQALQIAQAKAEQINAAAKKEAAKPLLVLNSALYSSAIEAKKRYADAKQKELDEAKSARSQALEEAKKLLNQPGTEEAKIASLNAKIGDKTMKQSADFAGKLGVLDAALKANALLADLAGGKIAQAIKHNGALIGALSAGELAGSEVLSFSSADGGLLIAGLNPLKPLGALLALNANSSISELLDVIIPTKSIINSVVLAIAPPQLPANPAHPELPSAPNPFAGQPMVFTPWLGEQKPLVLQSADFKASNLNKFVPLMTLAQAKALGVVAIGANALDNGAMNVLAPSGAINIQLSDESFLAQAASISAASTVGELAALNVSQIAGISLADGHLCLGGARLYAPKATILQISALSPASTAKQLVDAGVVAINGAHLTTLANEQIMMSLKGEKFLVQPAAQISDFLSFIKGDSVAAISPVNAHTIELSEHSASSLAELAAELAPSLGDELLIMSGGVKIATLQLLSAGASPVFSFHNSYGIASSALKDTATLADIAAIKPSSTLGALKKLSSGQISLLDKPLSEDIFGLAIAKNMSLNSLLAWAKSEQSIEVFAELAKLGANERADVFAFDKGAASMHKVGEIFSDAAGWAMDFTGAQISAEIASLGISGKDIVLSSLASSTKMSELAALSPASTLQQLAALSEEFVINGAKFSAKAGHIALSEQPSNLEFSPRASIEQIAAIAKAGQLADLANLRIVAQAPAPTDLSALSSHSAKLLIPASTGNYNLKAPEITGSLFVLAGSGFNDASDKITLKASAAGESIAAPITFGGLKITATAQPNKPAELALSTQLPDVGEVQLPATQIDAAMIKGLAMALDLAGLTGVFRIDGVASVPATALQLAGTVSMPAPAGAPSAGQSAEVAVHASYFIDTASAAVGDATVFCLAGVAPTGFEAQISGTPDNLTLTLTGA